MIRLSHFAEVAGVYHVHNLPAALMVHGLHLWSEETVTARFAYRYPGLFIMPGAYCFLIQSKSTFHAVAKCLNAPSARP